MYLPRIHGGIPLKTVEEVDIAIGLPRATERLRINSSTCGYNPYPEDDPARDCSMPGRWHVRCRSSENKYGFSGMIACDVHLGRLLGGPYAEAVVGRHEFGSSCGLEETWWIEPDDETGSFCCSTERGVELGFLKYEDRPGGDLEAS